MRFLVRERERLNALLPALGKSLATTPFEELERPGGPAISLFREGGGAALLIPKQFGGLGADPVDAARVQRAVGAWSPSLAIATTMHHFSLAGLIETERIESGPAGWLLRAVADQNLLLASGFAEGVTGASVLRSSITARRDGREYVVSGSKKPCSLAKSMDILTASITIQEDDGSSKLAVALIPANSPGIEVRPFWQNPALAAAESDEVVLTDVRVATELVVPIDDTPEGGIDPVQLVGFLWFEMLMCASYLGAVSALAERVFARGRANEHVRTSILVDLENAAMAVESLAAEIRDGHQGDETLARSLFCRYALQEAIDRVAPRCVEALGGMSYIGGSEITYLAACTTALRFHPPGRTVTAPALDAWLSGSPLRIG